MNQIPKGHCLIPRERASDRNHANVKRSSISTTASRYANTPLKGKTQGPAARSGIQLPQDPQLQPPPSHSPE